eukprot:GEZU01018996.1.p1 GENE.GEZU01018996.1~~GEZU01018996.1.p1  ORF type:complete len:218 (+),score=50.43 GEZU01018996.1:66-719(+)
MSEENKTPTVTNRVYVGNLAWQTSWQNLKDHMRQAGTVVYADVFMDRDGRSRGCGIVEYESSEEAKKAIDTLTNTTLDGRLIFVREDREDKAAGGSGRGGRGGARPSRGGRPSERRDRTDRGATSTNSNNRPAGISTQIFVGNLPFSTTNNDLINHFSSVGRIVRAEVATRDDGRSKGFATIKFENEEDAQKAINDFDNTEFQGRKLTVKLDKFGSD